MEGRDIQPHRRDELGEEGLGKGGGHVYGDSTVYDYTVTFESKGLGRLFNLAHAGAPEALSRFQFVETHQGLYRAVSFSGQPFSYRARTARLVGTVAPDGDRGYLDVPPADSPRLLALVDRLAGDGGSAADKVARLEDFLREGGFSYGEPGVYRGENFLGEFLFGRKNGLGGHFASAAGLLLRHAGVPSRIVVGFQGGRKNPYGNFWTVSTGDFHSWVEYWDGTRAGSALIRRRL